MNQNILVISCMDLRIVDKTEEALTYMGYKTNYDYISLAGSSLAIGLNTDHLDDDGRNEIIRWKETIFDHIVLAKQLHNIKEIFLIDHEDCGAYTKFATDKMKQMSLEDMHLYNLDKARNILKKMYPDLKIRIFLLFIKGSLYEYVDDKKTLLFDPEFDTNYDFYNLYLLIVVILVMLLNFHK